jgi:hypothetical protein
MAGLTHAQGTPQRSDADRLASLRQSMRQAEEKMLERRTEERSACDLPDGTRHPLTTVVSYEGQSYRCVEVFTPNTPGPLENQTLTVRIAGWIKVQAP